MQKKRHADAVFLFSNVWYFVALQRFCNRQHFCRQFLLRKTWRLQLCQGRFVVVGEQTCNLTVSVLSFSGRRVLSCWCRLCAVYSQRHCRLAGWATACFPSKVCRHSVPLFVFTYFSGGRCTFCFLCVSGSPSVLVQALHCFSQRHCRLGRWGNGMFSVKSLQAQRVFFVCGFFRRKNVLQSVFVDAFLYNIICFVPRLKAV